jgi:hypothetical protein
MIAAFREQFDPIEAGLRIGPRLLEAKLEAELDDWPIDVYPKPNRFPANAFRSMAAIRPVYRTCMVRRGGASYESTSASKVGYHDASNI